MFFHAAKVREFYEMIGYPRPIGSERGTGGLSSDDVESIRVMLREELRETIAALDAQDDFEFLDGLADLVFVAYGAAHKIGANLDEVLDRVCDSNLTKTPGDKGRGFRRDALKGEGYVPPAVDEIDETRLWSEPIEPAPTSSNPIDDRGNPICVCTRSEKCAMHSETTLPLDNMAVDVAYPLVEASVIRQGKAQDYMAGGGSSTRRLDYNPFGLASYVHNVHEKSTRIVSVAMRTMSLPVLDEEFQPPCCFCGYQGEGFWDAGTHSASCPFREVAGLPNRAMVVGNMSDAPRRPNFESIRDSAIDAINYLAFLVEFIDGKTGDR